MSVPGTRSSNVRYVLARLPADDCIDWPGMRDREGYGVIASQLTHIAHRYVYILLHGTPTLPELDHTCRNRACCNPAHLEPVTAAENARRRVAATPACPKGHEYTPENTYRYRGHRFCRTCRRAADRKRPSGGRRRTASLRRQEESQ